MNIRNINRNDYQLIELHQQFKNDKLNISRLQFQKYVESLNNSHQVVIILIDEKIVASGTLLIETKLIHNLGKVAHIEDIIVDEFYRNRKLGKIIIDYLTSISKENNCYKVILNCTDENVKFYEKCGFQKKENQMALYF